MVRESVVAVISLSKRHLRLELPTASVSVCSANASRKVGEGRAGTHGGGAGHCHGHDECISRDAPELQGVCGGSRCRVTAGPSAEPREAAWMTGGAEWRRAAASGADSVARRRSKWWGRGVRRSFNKDEFLFE